MGPNFLGDPNQRASIAEPPIISAGRFSLAVKYCSAVASGGKFIRRKLSPRHNRSAPLIIGALREKGNGTSAAIGYFPTAHQWRE
jgi:hypothetical protein